ncbi:AAA family ATPase [Sulfitobacter sabulilitoris]|uniref:histidine kinase n=1 Tax=Sulfitobacter sabulilitoris TaxID=2562655 RepID=A0A5S3P829_9RHOB|nr:AAA family ATPase [Sulfitobacter sabulilitoris]TMM49557.1 response regulator [Sulfitobacter sabulilitoris]
MTPHQQDEASAPGLYRTDGGPDGTSVLIWEASQAQGDVSERIAARLALFQDHPSPYLARPVAFERNKDAVKLLMEYPSGSSLGRLIRVGRQRADQFLGFAMQMAEAVELLHNRQTAHGHLSPAAFFVNTEKRTLRLALHPDCLTRPAERPSGIEGRDIAEILYCAPEQSGRTDAVADLRADLYALGVVFHEMLTGAPPFESIDKLELLHLHLAVPPPDVTELRADIPPMVVKILQKLLEKAPGSRYQTAFGLLADLRLCRDAYARDRAIPDFDLGARDAQATFRIPDKPYGRDRIFQKLERLYGNIATGEVELLLVSGPSGSGKSTIAEKLRDMRQGDADPVFASGKYDEIQGFPYLGLVQALRDYVLEKLARDGDEVNRLRQRLREGLGDNLAVLTDFIPELQHLVGDTGPARKGDQTETNQRFRLAMQAFFEVLSDAEAPLILFLDDLQWADGASISLIEDLLVSASLSHLMIVGAFRDTEVGENHRLRRLFDSLQDSRIGTTLIEAMPLSIEDTRQMIVDTMHLESQVKVDDLAKVIQSKTLGNPLYVRRLLTELYSEGAIRFDVRTGQWQWVMDALTERVVEADVAQLMTERIKQLSAPAVETLRVAAIFGTRFLAPSLRIVLDMSDDEIMRNLNEAAAEGFVIPVLGGDAGMYRFGHDMVRNAAYHSLPEAERSRRHFSIGSYLLKDIRDPATDDRLFGAMDQIALGADLIDEPGIGRLVTRGAIFGARRAKTVAAYDIAQRYLALVESMPAKVTGINWDTEPEITQELTMEAMEIAFMTGGFPAAKAYFDDLIAHLDTNAQKASVYQVLVTLHTARSDYVRAIELGVEGLKLLGVNLSGAPGPKILAQLTATQLELRRHDVFDFSILPDMDDPQAEQLIEMLMIVSTPAFLQNKDLFVLISLRMLRLTLSKGLTSAGVFSIQNYAIVIYLAFKSVDKAYKIGTNLFDLLEPRDISPLVQGRFIYTYSVVVAWHFRRYGELRDLLSKGLVQSWTAADLEYVGYYYYSILKYSWLLCDPLDRVADQLGEFERYDKRLRNKVLSSIVEIYTRAVDRLTNPEVSPLWTQDDRLIEESMTGEASVGTFCTTELLLTHVFGDWAMVEELSGKLRAQEGFATLGPEFVDYHLLLGLSLTRASAQLGAQSERKRRSHLKKHLATLRKMAEKYPTNHRFQYPLLGAECARLAGKTEAAMALYEEAIRKAEDERVWSYAGIACECAAALSADAGDATAQAGFIERAHAAYAAWGATNKVRMIERDWPDLAPAGTDTKADAAGDDALDVTSIIKASQIILEVTNLDTLLTRLMQITLENAGADVGSLYLVGEDGNLRLAAEGIKQGVDAKVTVFRDGPALTTLKPSDHPREIVSQVAASLDPVILADARAAPRFFRLRYIEARAPKSLMCLPVTGSRGLQAVLHLENSLVEGVFTAERQEILTTLVSLAAISLSNAQLYARQSEALKLEKRASEELARVNRLKDEFLANTSHELRTPLNGIIGLADALIGGAKGEVPAPVKATLSLIASSGQRLSSLVTDILDLSRLREGELELQNRPLDLHTVVDVVFALMEPRALQDEIDLRNLVPKEGSNVLADENRLQQILFNLVDNAMKFSEGGQVTVSTALREDRVHVTVSDTGIGIPEEAQARIFNSFEKVDASDTSGFQGVGLGLAITKSLVEMHGGKITVLSDTGKGAAFTFDLLLTTAAPEQNLRGIARLADHRDRGPISGLGTATAGPGLFKPGEVARVDVSGQLIKAQMPLSDQHRYSTLVIDDDPINLEVLRNYLEMDGFEVELARDGREGLRRMEEGYDPDIVLLDVMMPGMSGYEVCRAIRTARPAASLPVVMLTAKNQVEDLRAGFAAGATDYLAKPFSREELSARMHAHIELARVSTAYERFVPVEFLKFLDRDSILDIGLGDNVARRMTVMFSDIRGFTSIAEKSNPSETFRFLNDYFGRVGPVVKANNGVVNQFLGDGMMSLFPGNPDEGVKAAVEIQREIRRINVDREAVRHSPVGTGIGLHTGDLIMGIIGDAHRLNGNVISDAVNLASRLEGVTAIYGAGIAVSEDVISAMSEPDRYPHRMLDTVRVIGRELPVVVYEVFAADPPESARLKAATRDAFEGAHADLRNARFGRAAEQFARIADQNPLDAGAKRLAERASRLAEKGAPDDWSGIEILKTK